MWLAANAMICWGTGRGKQLNPTVHSPYLWIEGLGRHILGNFLPWFTHEVPQLRVTVLFKVRNGNAEPVWLVKFLNRDEAKAFAEGYNGTLNDGDRLTTTRASLSDYLALVKTPSLLIEKWQNREIIESNTHPPALMERMEINLEGRISDPLPN
ncbi:hypothetical protein BDP27DRAFT_1372698 [Rhodocollybia butyracea]|uniref:Uncharacterized protein n=1 Tax=Rhodocollybia butyracea TaxID=206335 RepID=A0A9P5P413_9AGAR|nr:hypothetical protein BDP27DRAFT_1372698 [Rhodocollybia butyracea]